MKPKPVTFAARVPNWLGDAVLAIPAIRAIAECARRANLVILASNISYEIMRRLPQTIVFPTRTAGGSLFDSIGCIIRGSKLLRAFRPVIIVSFTRSATSALTCFLGRVPRRVGFADSTLATLYTDRVALHQRLHLVDAYSRLPESIGIRVADRVPSLELSDEDLARAEAVLGRYNLRPRSYFCLFPGATYGPSKRWHPSRFALLADMLADRLDATPVVLGSKSDSEACQMTVDRMRRAGLNLCGQVGLSDVMGILHHALVVVANDSGGMHLAAALGVPVVGLFFSSDPAWTRPVGSRTAFIYNRFECSPCFRRTCDLKHPCTETISVEEVYEVVTGMVTET